MYISNKKTENSDHMPYARSRNSTYRKRKSYRSRAPLTRRKRVYRPRMSLNKRIKRVALSLNETKLSNHILENAQLSHNITFYQLGFLATEQGVNNPLGTSQDQNNRIGQEIMAGGISFKFMFMNKQDRSNLMYKVFIFSFDRETGDNMQNNPTAQDPYFWTGPFSGGAQQNRMLDRPRTTIKILKSMMIQPSAGANVAYSGGVATGLERTYYRHCWVKLNKKVVYAAQNGTVPRGRDIGLAVVAYDTYGTLTTDLVASFSYQATLYFKDP